MHSPFKTSFAFVFTALLGLIISSRSIADEAIKSQAKETSNDIARGTKKAGRAVKEKTCELVNGKMECAAQKLKHGVQNTADKVEDAVD